MTRPTDGRAPNILEGAVGRDAVRRSLRSWPKVPICLNTEPEGKAGDSEVGRWVCGHSMRLRRLLMHLGGSLWFVPVLCVIAGAAISFGTIALDRLSDYGAISNDVVGDPNAARSILSTVAVDQVAAFDGSGEDCSRMPSCGHGPFRWGRIGLQEA